ALRRQRSGGALVRTTTLCWYCGRKATVREHQTPLRRGGQDTADNIVPACQPCNILKGKRTVEEYRLVCQERRQVADHRFYGETHVTNETYGYWKQPLTVATCAYCKKTSEPTKVVKLIRGGWIRLFYAWACSKECARYAE